MIKVEKCTCILLTVLFSHLSFAQSELMLNKIDDSYQHCLDKGIKMLDCSKVYYEKMDSMLNLVYKKKRSKCDSLQRMKLKSEQLKWLKKRDEYFTKVSIESNEEGLYGEDEEMAGINKKAQFVRDRIVELINKE